MHWFYVRFQNAVELECLTVSNTDAAVQGAVFGKFVDAQPLRRCHHPARQTATQHHGVTRLQLLFRTFSTDITVVLLIHAVEADQQEVVTVEAAGQAVF
ncbi:hypothetical protein D3C80_1654530 [compost metagenome]